MPLDRCFPGVAVQALLLLGLDMLALEPGVGPPLFASAVGADGFGEKLIPIPGPRVGVILPTLTGQNRRAPVRP